MSFVPALAGAILLAVPQRPRRRSVEPLVPAAAGITGLHISARSLIFVVVAAILAPASTVSGQADPRTLPRWNPANIRQEASITFPGNDGNGVMTNYGGAGVGVSEDGRFLYASCMQALSNGNDQRRGQVVTWNLPAPGGVATVAAPCQGLTMAQLASVSPDPQAFKPMMGGVLEIGGQLLVTGFITYDAGATATKFLWRGPSLASLQGPYAPPAAIKTGIVKNYMGRIPPEWQAALGGKAFATAGYSSIVGRASYGESFIAFNPEDATRDGFPMLNLMSCPVEIAKCQARYGAPTNLLEYNGSEIQGGAMIIPGTRTLAYIVRESEGPTCYGYSTRNPAEHGTPYPSPEGVVYCYSLSDPLNEKGPKGYPYTLGVRLYDLADLVAVRLGTKAPHDVAPYDFVRLPNVSPGVTLGYAGGGAFNETNGCWYQTAEFWPGAGGAATVPVYCGFGIGSGGPTGTPRPYNFRASVSGATVALAWDGTASQAVSNVLVEVGSAPGQSDLLASAPLGAVSSYVATNVPPGAYYTRLRAIGPAGYSAVSNEATFTVGAGPGAGITSPGAPLSFYGQVAAGTVSMSWHLPTSGGAPTGIVLEAGYGPGRIDIVSGYPLGLVEGFVVPGVPPGTYYVRLRAVNAVGAGPASNEIVITVR